MKKAGIFIVLFIGTAVGIVWWQMAVREWWMFSREVAMAERRSEAIGGTPKPARSIEVVIAAPRRNDCIAIEKAEVDVPHLWIEYRNQCKQEVRFVSFKWRLTSVDGTNIGGGFRYVETLHAAPMERGEVHHPYLPSDPRIAKVEVSIDRR